MGDFNSEKGYEKGTEGAKEGLLSTDLSSSSQFSADFNSSPIIPSTLTSELPEGFNTHLYAAVPMSGSDLFEKFKNFSFPLPIGCPDTSIDKLLQGGVMTGELLEIVGETATGKTQLCHHSALHTAGALEGATVAYIDTGNCFSPDRLNEIFCSMNSLQNQSEDGEDTEIATEGSPEEFFVRVLAKIRCFKCFDSFSLLSSLETFYSHLLRKEEEYYCSLRLIIIDSLAAVVAPLLGQGAQSAIGYSVMMEIAKLLKMIAFNFNIAIIYTNYMVSVYGDEEKKVKPALGESWVNVPHTRLLLSRDHSTGLRFAKLLKSKKF